MVVLQYEEACIAAAQDQMPILWEYDEGLVREYLWQSGGFVMVLRRESEGGAYILLGEGYAGEGTFLVEAFSGDECEGHKVAECTNSADAVWWFVNAGRPVDVCPCVADWMEG